MSSAAQKWNGFGDTDPVVLDCEEWQSESLKAKAEARSIVARALASGLLSVRPMSPQDKAFVEKKLKSQISSEQSAERIYSDPQKRAARADYQRRYGRNYRKTLSRGTQNGAGHSGPAPEQSTSARDQRIPAT